MRPGAWLRPLGALFGLGAAVRVGLHRRGLLRQARLGGPVISVGNLSVGGSGKTPAVALIAETLREAGLPVSILSRGYGGSFAGEALIVADGNEVLALAALAGDEPVMLARSLPGVVVAVGPRRDRVGRAVERRFGPRVHILDDGFQHLRLARDLDVLCVSAEDLEDRPLPAGRLREFPRAASRAHVILWNGGEPSREEAARRLGCQTFAVRRRVDGFFDLEGRPRSAPGRPYLLAGIARPERFAADVASCGVEPVGCVFFGDHHPFGAAEVEEIAGKARSSGADALVTTAKDAVRIPEVVLPLPILVLRISAEVANEGALRARIVAVARRIR